jgi:hypothetical protein
MAERFKGQMVMSLQHTAVAVPNSTDRLLVRIMGAFSYDDRDPMDRCPIQESNCASRRFNVSGVGLLYNSCHRNNVYIHTSILSLRQVGT